MKFSPSLLRALVTLMCPHVDLFQDVGLAKLSPKDWTGCLDSVGLVTTEWRPNKGEAGITDRLEAGWEVGGGIIQTIIDCQTDNCGSMR